MWDGAVAGDRFVQEVLGQRRVLTGGDDPASVVAGVDVDQDVQVEPDAFGRAAQLGDIPAPHLGGSVGKELGFDLGRVGGLGASFSGLAGGCSDPVHARQGAPVPALVQLADPHLPDRKISVTNGIQHAQDGRPLSWAQRLGRRPALGLRYRWASHRRWPQPAVVAGPSTTGQCARRPGRHPGLPQAVERHGHDLLGGVEVPVLSESISKSSCAFPMMSNAVRVWVSWAVKRTFWARNRATSPRSLADPFELRVDVGAPPSPVRAPASRAEVHSLIWEWYSPSLRSTAPFSPRGADSYSATTANLYAAVNERLTGRGAGSGTTASVTASPVSSADELLRITFSLQSCPTVDGRVR